MKQESKCEKLYKKLFVSIKISPVINIWLFSEKIFLKKCHPFISSIVIFRISIYSHEKCVTFSNMIIINEIFVLVNNQTFCLFVCISFYTLHDNFSEYGSSTMWVLDYYKQMAIYREILMEISARILQLRAFHICKKL